MIWYGCRGGQSLNNDFFFSHDINAVTFAFEETSSHCWPSLGDQKMCQGKRLNWAFAMRCLGVEEAETAASSKPQVRLSASGGLLHDYSWKGSRGAVSANGYLTNNSKWTCDGQSYVVFWCVSWKPPIQRCPGQRKRVVVRSETFWWGELWWQKNRNLTFLSGWIFHPWTRIVSSFNLLSSSLKVFFLGGAHCFRKD